MKGEVTTWYGDKGWGFIHYGEKRDQKLFLHKSDISGYPERDSLPEGEKVKFSIHDGVDGKPKAIKVKPLSEVESGESSSSSQSPARRRRAARSPSPRFRRRRSPSPARHRRRRSPSPRYRRRRSPSPRYRRRRSPPRRRDGSSERYRPHRPHRPRYVNPRFCLDFKRGDCRYGSRCRFSHEEGGRKRSHNGDDHPVVSRKKGSTRSPARDRKRSYSRSSSEDG